MATRVATAAAVWTSRRLRAGTRTQTRRQAHYGRREAHGDGRSFLDVAPVTGVNPDADAAAFGSHEGAGRRAQDVVTWPAVAGARAHTQAWRRMLNGADAGGEAYGDGRRFGNLAGVAGA